MRYLKTNSVHISVTLNGLIGGMLHEMLSSRAYRCGWWVVVAVIDGWFELVFDDLDHCQMCFEKQTIEGIYDL
jgi:hypothetical protein